MKRKALKILTAVIGGSTAVTGLLATPALGELLPGSIAGYLAIATASVLGLKEAAEVIGDYLDDGKRNGSFPTR